MESVERPWTVESPDQLDTQWRAALRQLDIELSSDRTCLCVPPWKRDRRHRGCERSWLLFDSAVPANEAKPEGLGPDGAQVS